MKKASLLIALLATMQVTFAQQRETALTTIGSMKVKINLNQATSTATITLIGPSTKWFSIGLNTSSMSVNKDVITFGTTLLDQYFTSSGHVAPTTDTTNNLTLVSNTVSGTTRTVVMTRPFSTGDAKDYTFTYAMTSLGIVWGVGPSTTVTAEHSTFGTKTLTFADVLANETFQLKDIAVTPNPSTGVFNISKNDMVDIKTIRVFDANAKLIREISTLDSQQSFG
ncbi:MAG: hypothetical protein JST78_04680 [Bacteroidetes bacterium]|nr:hypothetical protein [Bacteroidota bacterium]